MADQTAHAPAWGLRRRPGRALSATAASYRPVALSLLGCLLLAAASIGLQGFQFGVDNNLFHIPIVLRWYDLPQFADDAFIQSLRGYATPVYPLLSLVATEANILAVFLGAHLLTRALTFYALLQAARAVGLRGLWPAAALVALSLASPLYGSSAIGRDELFTGLFTHTELAQAVALLGVAWLIRGDTTKAALAAGIAFDLNIMVGAWMLAPLALRMLAQVAADPPAGRAAILRGALFFGLAAAPELLWLATSGSFTRPRFNYAAYLADYYPYHFFIGWASWPDRFALALQATAGLVALWFLPKNRLGAAAALLGFAVVFGLGALIDSRTQSRLILNLHLLRVDGLLLWTAALLIASAACAALASARPLLLPGALIALAALVVGQWPLVLAGMLLLVAADAVSAWCAKSPWPHRTYSPALAVLLLAGALGGGALLHRGYSVIPPAPKPLEPPSDAQLLGAAPRSPEWRQVTLWARERTAADAVFLVPWKLDFVAAAKRRSWVGWKEGASPMWAPETYARWRERGEAVRALPNAQAQLAYACAHRIDYVVVDKRRAAADAGPEVPPAYSNRWFTVLPAHCNGRPGA